MLTEAHLREILRFDYVYFAVGILIFTVGILSLVESFLIRPRQRMVLLFGVIGTLYGMRLLLQLGTVQLALGMSDYADQQVRGVLSYLIPPAGIYLWSTLIGPRRRKILLAAVAAHAVFAMCGIPYDLLTHHPWSFVQVNNTLVIVTALLTAGVFVLEIRDGCIPLDTPMRAMGAGYVLFLLGVVYDNLQPLRILPSLWVEPFCFAGFLFAMGLGIQYRIAADRNRLAAMYAEMEQARRIQLSILPVGPPASPHYQVAARYSPMTSVAGDLYDFVLLPHERLGLFIADVAGHGVPAALVASMLKTALALQTRDDASPAALLAELNRLMCEQSHGQLVTAAFAVLDPAAQILTYSAAGHPPLLLWNEATSGISDVEENGLPLGVLPSAQYKEVTVPFRRGARLAMYTDGIVESENTSAEEFGKDRLSRILARQNGNAGELLRVVMNAVEQWRGSHREQSDDLTLLVAEYSARTAVSAR
jgi:sigma-B regulation protein RsbU (phosphoserine phosphatase)